MAGFNFANRRDIEKAKELVRRLSLRELRKLLPGEGPEERKRLTEGWIFKSPAGGIPARAGTTCGSAECTPYYIDENGDLIELKDDSGASQTLLVYHIGSIAVAASAFILAKQCYGVLVADMEDCP